LKIGCWTLRLVSGRSGLTTSSDRSLFSDASLITFTTPRVVSLNSLIRLEHEEPHESKEETNHSKRFRGRQQQTAHDALDTESSSTSSMSLARSIWTVAVARLTTKRAVGVGSATQSAISQRDATFRCFSVVQDHAGGDLLL